jgi:hypothetical protein
MTAVKSEIAAAEFDIGEVVISVEVFRVKGDGLFIQYDRFIKPVGILHFEALVICVDSLPIGLGAGRRHKNDKAKEDNEKKIFHIRDLEQKYDG